MMIMTMMIIVLIIIIIMIDGAIAKSSANGLVGNGFASWNWIQPQVGFLKTQWIGQSHYTILSLTSNLYNYLFASLGSQPKY